MIKISTFVSSATEFSGNSPGHNLTLKKKSVCVLNKEIERKT